MVDRHFFRIVCIIRNTVGVIGGIITITNRGMCKITYEDSTGFETRSFLGNALYRYLVQPVLNRLPAKAQTNVRKSHKFADEMVTHRTSHRALDIIYSDSLATAGSSLYAKIAYAVWRNTDNVIGVRNRLRIVEREIARTLDMLVSEKNNRPLRMLSIAAGSSRSFVEVLSKRSNISRPIEVTFLDKSEHALEYSKRLVHESQEVLNKNIMFQWVQGTANTYLRGLPDTTKYDLVEMVGLMDYFEDEKFVQTISEIRSHLVKDGMLITGNILPNNEERFLSNVIDWKMIYRTPEGLCDLTCRAGFTNEHTCLFVEPMGVHAIVCAVNT